MTVDRKAVIAALQSASSEGFATSKDVAVAMGIKGSSPLIKAVRKELDVLSRQGRIETEVHPVVGRRYRFVDEPSGPAGIVARMERRVRAEEDGTLPEEPEDDEDESPEEPEDEPEPEPETEPEPEPKAEEEDTRRGPVGVHRALTLLSDGQPRRLMELGEYGVSSTTLKPMREGDLVVSRSEGYVITENGRFELDRLNREYANLRGRVYEKMERPEPPPERPKGRVPTTVHAMLSLLEDGRPHRAKDLMAAGVGEKTHYTVYRNGWCERTSEGYVATDAGRARLAEIERDWPELAGRRPEPLPAEPEPEAVPIVEELPFVEELPKVEEAPIAEDPRDPEPDDPPIGEAENAVVVDLTTVYRLTLRTSGGTLSVDMPACNEGVITGVLGRMRTMYDAVGRAVRVRKAAGEVQVGHILDDVWRSAR